ncbi:hypothetical protein GCM10022419_033210 [Nonomuraea rosea]|uniref:Type I restriction modification DNA specificity domain-containing protein n=1 Tax=Nonomuraea rosea TaxID=638574 RepID=A0ABP6WK19_9ACTN
MKVLSSRRYTFSELVDENLIEVGAGRPRSVSSELAILRVADVLDGKIKHAFMVDAPSNPPKETASKVSRPGDVVLTAKGTVGRVAIMPPGGPKYAYSPQLIYFRPTPSGPLLPRYLYYWLKSAEFWAQASHLKSQTDMADFLALSDILSLSIALPQRYGQETIAALLGSLDDKIAVNERTSDTALKLAEALYLREAAHSEWKSIALGDAAIWLSGGTPKTGEPSFWGGEIPWISALSLKSPWIDSSDRNVTDLGTKSGTRLVPAEVVLFVVRGSSLKTEFRIGITQREVAFGQDCKALIPCHQIDPHVLFHGIRSNTQSILEMVDETSIGAGRLSTDLITKLEIRVPQRGDSQLVAELRALDELAATRRAESRSLAELRDTLLPQLMSGRLRVRDAEKIVEDMT